MVNRPRPSGSSRKDSREKAVAYWIVLIFGWVWCTVLLALQLHFLFKMRGACGGLMGPSPERPGDDVSGLDVLLVQPHGHAADLLHRPAGQGHGPIGAGLAPAWVGRMARSLAARQSLSRHSGDGGLPPAWQRPA